jgi:hypothetical protein
MVEHLAGDFRLIEIEGHAGMAIRLGQWLNGDGFANYEHAQVFLGGNWFLDAQPGGAMVHRHDDLGKGMWSSGIIPLTAKQRVDITTAAYGHIGTPYSFLDYASLAALRFRIPAPHLRDYIKSTGHQICSQLVDQCYVDAGVHLFNDQRWPGDVTPGDLYKLLKEGS